MTVAKFNPTQQLPVSFSEAAIKHLTKQVAQKHAQGIEFKIKQSGCSGYKYLLELAFEPDSQALTFKVAEALDLFVSEDNLKLIRGTQVDYCQEGVNYKLTFNNPNATAHCGCGESFSVS